MSQSYAFSFFSHAFFFPWSHALAGGAGCTWASRQPALAAASSADCTSSVDSAGTGYVAHLCACLDISGAQTSVTESVSGASHTIPPLLKLLSSITPLLPLHFQYETCYCSLRSACWYSWQGKCRCRALAARPRISQR